MKCDKCVLEGNNFEYLEKDIQDSHDVPKYLGGTDKDGRHWLCKKHHDIYEKVLFSVVTKNLSEEIKVGMRQGAKGFARTFFKGEKRDDTYKTPD